MSGILGRAGAATGDPASASARDLSAGRDGHAPGGRREMSRGLRVLTSGTAAQDALMIRSGPLRSASAADWLGNGGLDGVRVLAAALYGCVPAIAAGVHAPDKQPGQAKDVGPTGPLAAVVYQAASVVDDLAAELTRIDGALDEQAHIAARYGARIGVDRRPPPAFAGPPADSGTASEQHWTLAYHEAYAQATADAYRARQQAARRLAELHATLAPPRPSRGPTAAATGGLTIGQLLVGLSSQLAGSPGAKERDPRLLAQAALHHGHL